MPDRLTEIAARAEAATPGPWEARCRASGVTDPEYSDWFLGWEVEGPPEPDRGQYERGHDALFVAHARTDIPFLLARIAELEEAGKALCSSGARLLIEQYHEEETPETIATYAKAVEEFADALTAHRAALAR